MRIRHSSTITDDVSDDLMTLAERPAELIDTRTFIRSILPSIQAARDQNYSFEQIAEVISKRLHYSIAAKTVSKYYYQIRRERRGKGETRRRSKRPIKDTDRPHSKTSSTATSGRSPTPRTAKSETLEEDSVELEILAEEREEDAPISEMTEGDRPDIALEESQPTKSEGNTTVIDSEGDRPEESDDGPNPKRVLTQGNEPDLSQYFHTY